MLSKVINSFDTACGDYKLHVTWSGHESNHEEPEPAPTAADIPTRPMCRRFVAVTGIRAQSRESPTGYGFLPPYHPGLSHTFCLFSWKRLSSVYNLLFSDLLPVKLTNKQTKQTEKKKKPISFVGWDLPPVLGSYIWTMRRGIMPQNRIIASCNPVTVEGSRVNSSSLPFPITGSSRSFPNSSWVQENAVPSPGDGEGICLWTSTWDSIGTQHFGAPEPALHVLVDTLEHCYSCSTAPSKWHYVSRASG